MILVRATINLPGLPAGKEAMVDPLNPVIASYLRADTGYLVPVGGITQETLEVLVEDSGSVESPEDVTDDYSVSSGEPEPSSDLELDSTGENPGF